MGCKTWTKSPSRHFLGCTSFFPPCIICMSVYLMKCWSCLQQFALFTLSFETAPKPLDRNHWCWNHLIFFFFFIIAYQAFLLFQIFKFNQSDFHAWEALEISHIRRVTIRANLLGIFKVMSKFKRICKICTVHFKPSMMLSNWCFHSAAAGVSEAWGRFHTEGLWTLRKNMCVSHFSTRSVSLSLAQCRFLCSFSWHCTAHSEEASCRYMDMSYTPTSCMALLDSSPVTFRLDFMSLFVHPCMKKQKNKTVTTRHLQAVRAEVSSF